MDRTSRTSSSEFSGSEEEGEDNQQEQHRLVPTPDPAEIASTCNMTHESASCPTFKGQSTSYNINNNCDIESNAHASNFYSRNHLIDPRDFYNGCIVSAKSQGNSRRRFVIRSRFKCSPLRWLLNFLPILHWLPNYKWKSDLTYDLIAGVTVCVMHIPQGMGYALLGNLQPVVGIYMAFFPVIVYSIMGTSRHVSMGTFAVICLMTGKVVVERLAAYQPSSVDIQPDEAQRLLDSMRSNDSETDIISSSPYTAEQIATAVSFTVGLWQMLMGTLRLGSLCVLLSSELVSGFTTGAAIHVFTSQVKNLLGLTLPRRNGIFKIPKTYYDIFSQIESVNVTAIIFSVITVSFLVLYNELLKPLVAKRIKFPIPVELLTIVVGTLVSRYWITSAEYGIPIVDDIPTGLPLPALPPMAVVKDVLIDGLIIAIVAYTISISMANIFAHKHDYKVNANQELIANGASNVAGGFFGCAPIAASLSRSLIQEQVGGRTQLAGFFSCFLLVFVLLWVGPFFETLPHCVLSSMIVVALKGMFMQFLDVPKALKESYLNAAVWISAFTGTVVLDIEYGLGIGLLFSVFSLIWKSNKPEFSVLGVYPGSNLYMDISCPAVKEIPGIKILKYIGSLNFATIEIFVKNLERTVPVSQDRTLLSRKASGVRGSIIVSTITKEKISDHSSDSDHDFASFSPHPSACSWIILDMSSVSSIDPAAVKVLVPIYKLYLKGHIQLLFVGCASPVIEVMVRCGFFSTVSTDKLFPSVHDAVAYCVSHSVNPASKISLSYPCANNNQPLSC